MSDLILVERRKSVATLTMNRPERKNALSRALINALRETLLDQLNQNVTAIIITGSGGSFSAGADLNDIQGTIEDIVVDEDMTELIKAIQATPVPVIAAIDGPCIGAAVDLCLGCDLRVASRTAFFQVPATRLGLLYNPASIARIYGSVSHNTLVRLLVLGERFDAETALKAGLVSHLTETGCSQPMAESLIEQSKNNDPYAVEATKGLLNALANDQFNLEYWDQIRRSILSSQKRKDAVAAAKAKLQRKN